MSSPRWRNTCTSADRRRSGCRNEATEVPLVGKADFQAFPLITAYRDWYFNVSKRVDGKAGYRWFLASGWQERNARLFDLAAEVEKKLAGS